MTLIVACHYTNIILCQPPFWESSLMKTGPARPNHGTPAGRDFHYTFQPHSSSLDTFVIDISLIEVKEF